MLRAGKPPPVIEGLGERVRASLGGGIGNDAFIRFVRDLPTALGGDVDVLICLSILRDRDVLKKIGDARGGTGVKYGPGRKFRWRSAAKVTAPSETMRG